MFKEKRYKGMMPKPRHLATFMAALAFAVVGSFGLVSSATANNGNGKGAGNVENPGNSLRADSTPVNVKSVVNTGNWYEIEHGLGATADKTLMNEPVGHANKNRVTASTSDGEETDGVTIFDHLYLFTVDNERGTHKGQVTVYYEKDGEWQHITAQFNAKGELLHANGVAPTE